jgi:site-specific recombinase XerD
MINAAINDKIIAEDPRGKYTARPYVNPQRPFLTSEEIDRIDHFAVTTNNPTLRKVADWFLFGCYTGLRYSDVKNFDRKKIVNDRIILRTEKKEKDVSIQLHPRLEELLERLQPGVFTNQEVNSYLKHIATICNIDKLITFHISRHTFAVYYLTEGGPIETLSEVLGHSSIKTTKIYGKIINPKVDKDMAKVWGEPSRRSQQNGIKKPK